MSLQVKDIIFSIFGFTVPKIKKATDSKLVKVEESIGEIYPVRWANIDDLQYLSVSFVNTHSLNEDEKNIICKKLNKLFKV